MKAFSKIIAASAIGLAALTAGAHAESAMAESQALEMFNGNNFIVQRIDQLSGTSLSQAKAAAADKTEVAQVQQALAKNQHLTSALKAQNVEVNNIVAAEQAADGSMIFYVR